MAVKFDSRLCDTATAVLWNNLPVHLRCAESVVVFKKKITDLSSSRLNAAREKHKPKKRVKYKKKVHNKSK